MLETDFAAATYDPAGLPEKKRQHRAFIVARIALVLLFVGFWFTLFAIGYSMPYGFLVALLAETAMLLAFLRALNYAQRLRTLDWMHVLLLAGELVCHSAMFYFLGGVGWLGCIAFMYGVVYASVFLTWWQAGVFATLVCGVFLSIMMLDAGGVIPHQWYLPQDSDRYKDPEYLITTGMGFGGVVYTVTFWMVFLGNEMRRERDMAVRAYAQLSRAQDELRRLNEELELKVAERTKVLVYRAEHDTLTGLLNRGSITRRIHEGIGQARRGDGRMAVIMIDGDDFKSCNDLGGHAYGDKVLRAVADSLRESGRATDLFGRFGGDEFLAVLPATDAEGAIRYCERALKALAANREGRDDPRLPFPDVSFGIAIYPADGSTADELIGSADRAMYRAKASGGRRWRQAEAEVAEPAA